MAKGHKIERKVEVKTFIETVKNYTEDEIITTQHTFFHLNEEERKVFKEAALKEHLTAKSPILVGIQHNGNYAVFYDYSRNEALRLILDIQPDKIEIVTFYIIDKNDVPRI